MIMFKYKIKLIVFAICLIGWGGTALAQNYPVQITAQLSIPFSGFIPDYSTAGNQNLKLLVLFTDFTKPFYNIKLKLQITGQGITIQSKSYYYAGPITLQPGVPLEISGGELSGMLNASNLDFSGISSQYYQTKTLPEGYYNICFTAYDYNNPIPIQVSNQSCAFGWMVLSDPPFLNLPLCESTVAVSTPQNMMFQWTPMNINSPNSAYNTLYDFDLYEIHPGTQSPGNIIQTLPPIYQITTPFTFVNYGITEPQLYVGMQYVWRVRARDQSGRDLFKNQGYSQQCTFTYGSALSQIDSNSIRLTLQGTALTYRLAKYTWDSLAIFDSYAFQYRKQGTTNWFPVNTTTCNTLTNNLEPENTYEARVQGIYANGTGPWSNVVTITTPAKPVVVCGQGGVPPLTANFVPLKTGIVGQVWNIGQFDMLVTQLDNSNNPTGKYSGYGKIPIPFMLGMNLRGKFTDISVNEAMEVVDGKVEIVTTGVDAWVNQWEQQYHYDDSYISGGCIDSVFVSSGVVTITNCDGTSSTIPNNYSGGLLVQDTNGNQWVVNSDGTVTPVVGGGLLPNSTEPLTDDEMSILKKAMAIIRNDYDMQKITTLTTAYNSEKTNLDNHITQQRQPYPTSTTQDGDGGYIGYLPLTNIPSDAGTTLNIAFKNAETDLNTAKVLYVFSRENNTDAELNFIGKYLTVNSKPYKTFVAEQLTANNTQDAIASDVAQSGIVKLAENAVRKKMIKD
jgi:hypothetical protein